ncbi:sulfotransferase [candidate division KSB3 bacterium]|uniref:Sulfotransferase n=1 Tax=candidate division KSB3 bacterium TaxID=2044937 RepID=A0A9D5Q6P4_9BACT|nr:sulfotransferase [candidate division KSB3 bacterium]MBD3325452.1 sulfotransferase [candidate division KSB3 bacterium]
MQKEKHFQEHQKILAKYPDSVFDHVKYYVLFIGHGRSGHSLVGAILDAHPNIVIANELHALPLFTLYNYATRKIFKLILDRALEGASYQGWNNTGYNYNLPGLYQGSYEQLEVIGDKKGGGSVRYCLKHPEILDELIRYLGPILKVIYVVRNPYDCLSARAFRRGQEIHRDLIHDYFRFVDVALQWKHKLLPDQFYMLFHEKFVREKEQEIIRLCAYLDQTAPPKYLQQCCQLINPSPHKRRYKTKWSTEHKDLVRSLMQSEPYRFFFYDYAF